MKKILNVIDLGVENYGKTLCLQETIMDKRANLEIEDTLILVEHPPVITLGIKANRQSLKVSKEELANLGVEVYEILRGGAAFLHNPGQIVGYPIILLEPDQRRKYLQTVQQTMIDISQKYGISAVLHPNKDYIGVWKKMENGMYSKIGAIGIRFVNKNDAYVTQHGFALNVNNDSSMVKKLIYMCGCPTETCISWKEIQKQTFDLAQVKENIIDKLIESLGYSEFVKLDSLSLACKT